MANVKLKEKYRDSKTGDIVNLPATIARKLIRQGKAVGGNIFSSCETASVKQDETRTETVIPDNAYPIHKGAGYYELSNGEKVRGKAKAIKAQKELD